MGGGERVAGSGRPGTAPARDEELRRLKRKPVKVTQERGFLKEAAAYFAKESK